MRVAGTIWIAAVLVAAGTPDASAQWRRGVDRGGVIGGAPVESRVAKSASLRGAGDGNAVANGDFSTGILPWVFYTNGSGTLYLTDGVAGYDLTNPGSNAQLYQPGIALEGGTEYELSFNAHSGRGQDIRVALIQHGAPYSVYGLAQTVDLSTADREFEITFTTTPGDKSDARLQFWSTPYDAPGDWYRFDNVSLRKVADGDAGDGDGDGDVPACVVAAREMLTSCRFEIQEEYHATVASCVNIGDDAEQAECIDEAQAATEEHDELCDAQEKARLEVCELLHEDRYDPDPLTDESIAFVDPSEIGGAEPPNPYFSLVAGHTYVLRAGEDFEETVVVHVTDRVREILGVDCRLVVDIVLLQEDGEYMTIEVTDDFYAQAGNGDVYYCGELARNFEDGVLVDLDGSFEAGRDLAKSGVLIKAHPLGGDAHRQEYLLGEAEDVIRYVGLAEAPGADEGGENPDPSFGCAINGGCVKTQEYIPPSPEDGEFKYYLAGVGFVLGVALEHGAVTGERDELVCVGESLDILDDPACGIGDVAQLREQLCLLSPLVFCANGD